MWVHGICQRYTKYIKTLLLAQYAINCLSLILLNSILIKFKSIAGPYQLNKVNCVLKIIILSFQKDINLKIFTQNRIFLRLDAQTKMLKSFIPKKETLKIRLKLHKKIM